MTHRARRLAEYLESDLGWTVFDSEFVCSDGHTQYDGEYCKSCGKPVRVKFKKKQVLADIEKAIAWALGE